MNLYHLTAVPATGISTIAQGSFTADKQHELILSTGTSLELYRLQSKHSRLIPLFRQDVFAKIRCIESFRLFATRRDYIVITSDSGSLTILSADATTASFKQVHCEPFGRSGCGRIVPGQLLACEPRGRACMVGAVEKMKFAYVLNRDSNERLTISSPLEAHRNECVTYDIKGLDVGFDNPVFAALERAYYKEDIGGGGEGDNGGGKEKEKKKERSTNTEMELVYYELDLGLNTVVRKIVANVRQSSSILLPVPGRTDGPGGVLVCSAGYVTYCNLFEEEELLSQQQQQQQQQANGNANISNGAGTSGQYVKRIEAELPFRRGTDQMDTNIVCGTAYHDRKGNAFFFLICTEHGDLIKADLTWSADEGATALRLVYFDSLPTAAVGMTIFRSGFLFVALEGSDALLLKFRAVDVSDDDPSGGLSKSNPIQGDTDEKLQRQQNGTSAMEVDYQNPSAGANNYKHQYLQSSQLSRQQALMHMVADGLSDVNPAGQIFFVRKKRLAHLSVEGTLESLAPLLSINDSSDMNGSSFLLSCGRGSASSMRGFRRGLGVIEMSSPHSLPSRVTNVFTFKDNVINPYHRYIVVSFRDRTKVLAVGDARVEETTNAGFSTSTATLYAGLMGQQSFVQVHAQGVRFVPGGRADEATEWVAPQPSRIIAATANGTQAIIALSSATIVYFEIEGNEGEESFSEMDRVSDAVVKTGGDKSVSMGVGDDGAVPTVAIPEVPQGRRRANFFAIGDGANGKVRVYRVAVDGRVKPLGIHVAPAPIESLAFVDFGIRAESSQQIRDSSGGGNKTGGKDNHGQGGQYEAMLYIVIGTKHGAVVRVTVDGETGALGDKRSLFLGPERVRVRHANMGGVCTCFALSAGSSSSFSSSSSSSSGSGRAFVMYAQGGRVEMSPVSGGGEGIAHVAPLASKEFVGGFVAAQGSRFRLLCVDLLHALQAGADLYATPAPVPGQTKLASLFHLSRTRAAATVRRLARVAEIQKKKRPRTQSLFVVAESEQRVSVISGGNQRNQLSETGGNDKVELEVGCVGTWFSRILLVRMRGADGSDQGAEINPGPASGAGEGNAGEGNAEEGEDVDLDESDTLVSFSMDAVTIMDSVSISLNNTDIDSEATDNVVAVASTCAFGNISNEQDTVSYVIVSRARRMAVSATSPMAARERRDAEYGVLSVYRVDTKLKLVHVHDTRITEAAFVVVPFRDMVAVGVGTAVRLYALGKKQMLRKVEFRAAVRNRVCAIAVTGGDRLFVADRQESVTLFKYLPGSGGGVPSRERMEEVREGGRLVAVASDEVSRWVTCLQALDYSTVCGGDLFGNLFILRLPAEVAPGAEEVAIHGNGSFADGGTGQGILRIGNGMDVGNSTAGVCGASMAAHRLQVEACIHVGCGVSCVTSGRIDAGGQHYLNQQQSKEGGDMNVIYGTMSGAIGILKPFATRSDADFGKRLEIAMRKGWRSIVGRDHLSFRSSFYAARSIVDGDLCELFAAGSTEERKRWSEAVGRSERDVDRKLDELRAAIV